MKNAAKRIFSCKNRSRYSLKRAIFFRNFANRRSLTSVGRPAEPAGRRSVPAFDPAGRGPARPPAGRGSEVSSARQQREVAEAEGAKTHASAQIDEATAQIATTGLDELMPPPPVVAAGYPTAEVRKIGPADCPAPARDRKNDFCRLSLSVIAESGRRPSAAAS